MPIASAPGAVHTLSMRTTPVDTAAYVDFHDGGGLAVVVTTRGEGGLVDVLGAGAAVVLGAVLSGLDDTTECRTLGTVGEPCTA